MKKSSSKIKAIKKDLKNLLSKSVEENDELMKQLSFINKNWGSYSEAPAVAKLLKSSFRDVRYFASISLRISNNESIVPLLMKAIVAFENIGYAAPYVWACASFDCSKHISFFLKLILNAIDAGDVTWGSLAVIENMKGPFEEASLKRMIHKILRVKVPETTSDLLIHNLLFAETGSVLHKFLFEQVYAEWKNDK